MKSLPLPNYMELHENLQWRDRRELVKRFFSYSDEFNIPVETLFLALNCVDRYFCKKSPGNHFKILGAVAFRLAVKYERPNVHETEIMSDILYLSEFDKEYRSSAKSSIEEQLLEVLDHYHGTPSPFLFLRRIRTLDDSEQDVLEIAQYIAASTMLNKDFVGTKPSRIAAAS
ncbi:hypothetical protein LY78DRAFT_583668 [Colletotrichum sublineola]|nr:hypothetical protein LY78DRAFT_583668 [Colletotrichum sublineola]